MLSKKKRLSSCFGSAGQAAENQRVLEVRPANEYLAPCIRESQLAEG
jgi:hypothetical protein